MTGPVKPKMFKLGGAWVWLCEHPVGALVGDVFPVEAWDSAWNACLSAAVKHAMFYHGDAVEVPYLDGG